MLEKLIAYLARHQIAAARQDGYINGYCDGDKKQSLQARPIPTTTTSTGSNATITYHHSAPGRSKT